jgi:uncharacterized phage protein (TIGR01671 family)|nr:MAG TPA: YopX protein [Caudoviricetes sp.]
MVPRFRCWDERLGLTEVVSIDFFRKKIKINHWEYGDSNFFPLDEVVLMQSTGYKDKNGVEIFEGDLVKVSVDNGFDYLFEELSIVKPSKFHSGLVCSLKSHEAEYRIIHAEILGYEYEVVGNIYENSELLEQANEI